MRHLNDNVLQNVDKKFMGVKKYHNNGESSPESNLTKVQTLKAEAKQSIKKETLEKEEQREILDEL